MSYLAIARSALLTREKSEISPPRQSSRPSERSSACEISEGSEKSPGFEPDPLGQTLQEAERLKARVIAMVTADPAQFDRELYDALTAEWKNYEVTLARHDAGSDNA
jgi:hypothetical protein